jgi:hypothetical protein
MEKLIVLGPNGVIGGLGDGSGSIDQEYRRRVGPDSPPGVSEGFLATRTPWVRMWADWPTLQPDPARPPDEQEGVAGERWRSLVEQLRTARADGRRIILTPYRFTQWSNGTDHLVLGTEEERMFELADRTTSASPGGIDRRRSLVFRLPPDRGPAGPWGRWIAFLMDAFGGDAPRAGVTVDAIELVNEPNIQVFPMMGPSTSDNPFSSAGAELTVHRAVADLFVTARELNAERGDPFVLLGPSLQDGPDRNRRQVPFGEFTTALLDELDRRGFEPGPRFAWAHHNYRDLEEDRGVGQVRSPTTPDRGVENSVGALGRLLAGRWRGMQHRGAPAIWLTEGGVRMSRLEEVWFAHGLWPGLTERELAALLLERGWRRLHRDDGDGAGVALFANYLLYTSRGADSGLRELYLTGGEKREVFAVWTRLGAEARRKDRPRRPPPIA